MSEYNFLTNGVVIKRAIVSPSILACKNVAGRKILDNIFVVKISPFFSQILNLMLKYCILKSTKLIF